MSRHARLLSLVLALTVVFCAAATAQELRVETDVFVGDSTESIAHTVTMLQSGTFFDFTENPNRVAVFRRPVGDRPGRFILIDPASGTRTEVTTDKIQGLMTKLGAWAGGQEDPLLKFAAAPEFEEAFDTETGVLTLSSELWNYRVATIPSEGPTALARYREFVDWYSRLNTMLYGTLPPGPRLALNEALEKHGVLPVEIHRDVQSESQPVRATHLFTWRLSRTDRDRLDEARRQLATFEKVDNQAFVESLSDKDVVRGQSH